MDHELLSELRALVDDGVTPTALGLLPDHAELVERLVAELGTLGEARRLLSLPQRPQRWAAQEALAALRELHARGVAVNPQRLRELGEDHLVQVCYERFGSFPDAREAAGLPRSVPRARLGSDDVLAALRAVAVDDTVALGSVRESVRVAARKIYGSFDAALAAAGLRRRTTKAPVKRGKPGLDDHGFAREVELVLERHRVRTRNVPPDGIPDDVPIAEATIRFQRDRVIRALQRTTDPDGMWNLSRAAIALGTSRGQLYRMLARLGIRAPTGRR